MTQRQQVFLSLYLAQDRRNATQAAAQAGYSWPSRQGSRLLSYPPIASAVRADRERRRRAWAERREVARREAEARAEAEAERAWQAMPDWYRLGLPAPPGTYRRRRR